MVEAADRDRIARQYVTTYDDVFSLGLPALETARQRHSEPRWSTLAVYLTFLAAAPDTHIARKFDMRVAEAVRREAVNWREALTAARDPEAIAEGLLTWDGELKSGGINPGTSADLTVATLFASSLCAIRGDKYTAAILPLRANDA
jgi:triphosphoribosyl-dephospho-CoA synthase